MRVRIAWSGFLAFAFVGGAHLAHADEACGIVHSTDVIFVNGFDPAPPGIDLAHSVVLRTQKSAKVDAQGNGTPTLVITYPAANQTIAEAGTEVAGTFTGPAATGITVNGVLAQTSGNKFLVAWVPLAAGANTLQAKATALTGANAQASIAVTRAGTAPALTLRANQVSGYTPFPAGFTATTPPGITVSQMRVDYDGDGTDDFTTTDPAATLAHTYAAPGVYRVRLTLVDSASNATTAYAHVIARDLAGFREELCSVYGHLRTELAAGNVASAVLAFAPNRRAHYQTLFGGISAANLPVAASRLGTIANGLVGQDFAELKVVKMFQGKLGSFPLSFARDEDGVWRIEGM